MKKAKNPHFSPARTYRDGVAPGSGEVTFQVVVEQTDLFVLARENLSGDIAEYVREIRGQLKTYLLLHSGFGSSLTPVEVSDTAPESVRLMAAAARPVGVGPMAAVAGTVAQMVADRFATRSPDLLVENGGDVALRSTRERVVALLPDPSTNSTIGLRIAAGEFPAAVCSSSATIGHSLSLGSGDLVAVRAVDAPFADACATHLCNLLKSPRHVQVVLDEAKRLAEVSPGGVFGVFAQHGKTMAAWGDLELAAL